MVSTVAQPMLPQRVNRYPKHPFKLFTRPWQLQPFLCAPVLPGETLSNILLQTRLVTDPIKDALTGWWAEYYFFYVKLTDLDARDMLRTMIIDPDNADVSSLKLGAIEPWSYTGEGGIPWAKLCLKRVVEEYFRGPGETWDNHTYESVPLAAIAEERSSWMQSLIMTDDVNALDVTLSTAGDDAFTMQELENAQRTWEILKAHGLTKLSWEDYLTSAGVATATADEPHRPELIRHFREWTYPTNTVNASTGVPSTAVSFAVAERGDKARLFKEPGFILGVNCVRPKVYYRNQVGLSVGFHDSAAEWLPPMLQDDAWSSITQHTVSSGSGPITVITDAQGYTWDVRDLFLYGEQFVNFDASASTTTSMVDLPTSAAQREYVDSDDIAALFVSADSASQRIRQDGVVNLTIKGRQRDTTPAAQGMIA